MLGFGIDNSKWLLLPRLFLGVWLSMWRRCALLITHALHQSLMFSHFWLIVFAFHCNNKKKLFIWISWILLQSGAYKWNYWSRWCHVQTTTYNDNGRPRDGSGLHLTSNSNPSFGLCLPDGSQMVNARTRTPNIRPVCFLQLWRWRWRWRWRYISLWKVIYRMCKLKLITSCQLCYRQDYVDSVLFFILKFFVLGTFADLFHKKRNVFIVLCRLFILYIINLYNNIFD